jgi:hypothetical protein
MVKATKQIALLQGCFCLFHFSFLLKKRWRFKRIITVLYKLKLHYLKHQKKSKVKSLYCAKETSRIDTKWPIVNSALAKVNIGATAVGTAKQWTGAILIINFS